MPRAYEVAVENRKKILRQMQFRADSIEKNEDRTITFIGSHRNRS